MLTAFHNCLVQLRDTFNLGSSWNTPWGRVNVGVGQVTVWLVLLGKQLLNLGRFGVDLESVFRLDWTLATMMYPDADNGQSLNYTFCTVCFI